MVLSGLSPVAGFGSGLLRSGHVSAAGGWARGRRVFYINSRPGLRRGSTMSELVSELADALRSEFGEPVDVLGTSTGGSFAQQLAAEHPEVVRRLVLVSTGCRLSPVASRLQRGLAARVRGGAFRQAIALLAADVVFPGPLELPAALAGWLLAPLLSSEGLGDMATLIEAEDRFDLAELPAITAPTFLLAGGRDRYYGSELLAETAELIPNCKVEIHPRLGHVTVTMSPKAIAHVFGFLAEARWPAAPEAG